MARPSPIEANWRGDDCYAPHLDARAAALLADATVSLRGARWQRPDPLREYDTWIVDGEWVVRIARRPADAAKLEAERLLLSAVELPVPVPRIERHAPGIAVHRFVPGLPAEGAIPESAWPALAKRIASLLSSLHGTNAAIAAAAGLTPTPPPLREELHERIERALTDLAGCSLPAPIEQLPADLTRHEWSPAQHVVCHGDFKGEHVLVSPDDFEMCGLIDWADIKVAWPEVDFGGLVAWLGPRFAALVADHYDGIVDLRAATLHARYWALISLADAVAGREDWPRETSWSPADHARSARRRRTHWTRAVWTAFDE